MKRVPVLLSVTLCFAALGCGGFSHQPAPGPRPLPEPATPANSLRGRVARGSAEPVVLDDRDGLSPDEAALFAIDHNPRLRALRAERGVGQAELVAAGVLPNPRLEGALDVPVSGRDAKVLGYGAELSWNVTPLLARGARVSSAEENLTAIDLDIGWQEWQVAQAARLHTVRAIYLERRAALARELEKTWQTRLDALHRAQATGAVTGLEVINAEQSLAEARVNRLERDKLVVAERSELYRALGVAPAQDIVLDMSFAPEKTVANGDGILRELPQRRLDLIALQHAHRSHDEALRAAVLAQFPPMEIGFHAQREIDRSAFVGVSLSFEIPFFDRNQGSVARSRAQRTQVEAEYTARLSEARADVRRTLRELELVRQQLVAAHQAADVGTRLVEQARAAAVSGALSPLIAADVLERSYQSRLRALEIEQTLAELGIALDVASGVPGA